MILVDSCGWLEILGATPLGEAYRPALAAQDGLLVPTVCLLEVGRRLLTWRGEAEAAEGMAVMSQATLVPLDGSLAIAASRVGPATGLPCADSIIYATARKARRRTLDARRAFSRPARRALRGGVRNPLWRIWG